MRPRMTSVSSPCPPRLIGGRCRLEVVRIRAELVEIFAALIAARRQLRELGALLRRELEFPVATPDEAALERIHAGLLDPHLLRALLAGRARHHVRRRRSRVGATAERRRIAAALAAAGASGDRRVAGAALARDVILAVE